MDFINTHYVLFAISYFLQNFDDEDFHNKIFLLLFNEKIPHKICDMNNDEFSDPDFYSKEYQIEHYISKICFNSR